MSVVLDEDDDEFQPLFDYSGGAQLPVIHLDESGSEDDEDVAIAISHKLRGSKRRKTAEEMPNCEPSLQGNSQPADVENDENWLPSPPKHTKLPSQAMCTDTTILLLRQKKAELLSLTVKSSEESLASTESEVLNSEHQVMSLESQHSENGTQESTKKKGDKIVVMVQDKSGDCRPFRIYTDDSFDKLYHAYSQAIGKNVVDFVFRFDGEQVSSSSTPKVLGLEPEDILEVHYKATQ